MTASSDNRVVGVAVYLEFTKPNATQQIVIMPEGTSATGKQIPMTVYRRRLTITSPRKTWRQSSSPITMQREIAYGSPATKNDLIDRAITMLLPLLNNLKVNHWVLYKTPVLVEVTADDLELARLGKTPHKVLSRIWKSRKAFGFPKEYLHNLGDSGSPASVIF